MAALCEVAARSANANHILVSSLDRCNEIKGQILAAPDKFAEVREGSVLQASSPLTVFQ